MYALNRISSNSSSVRQGTDNKCFRNDTKLFEMGYKHRKISWRKLLHTELLTRWNTQSISEPCVLQHNNPLADNKKARESEWLIKRKLACEVTKLLIQQTRSHFSLIWCGKQAQGRWFLLILMKHCDIWLSVISHAAACCSQFDTVRICDDKRHSRWSLLISAVGCRVGAMVLQSSKCSFCSFQSVWKHYNHPQSKKTGYQWPLYISP